VAVQKIANTGTLDPLREQSSNASERWTGSILETLVTRSFNRDPREGAGLALSLTRVDINTVDAELRPDVVFHNGDTMTADDVVFSFGPERMFGGSPIPGLPSDIPPIARRHFPSLEKVEALGPLTVRFTTATPDVTLEGRLSAGGAEIVSKRAWLEAGSWSANSRAPVGSGPYHVVRFEPDERLVLAAHDRHWAGRPPFKTITFLEVPELAARIAGLQAGEFDFACDIPPDQIAAIEANRRYKVQGGLISNHRILAFDKTHKPLQNPKIRLAMAHAVDGNGIVQALWNGRTRVPPGLQWESYGDMFVPRWSVPRYDPVRAKVLIRETDYKGEPIIYRARHNYYTAEVDTAELLIEFWRAVGLNVKLEIKENWAQVLDPAGPRGLRDWSNSATFDDPVSSLVNQHGPHGAQQTNGEWANAEMNTLSAILIQSPVVATRHRAFARMLEICEREDPAYVVLHQSANFTALRKDMSWTAPTSYFMDFSSRAWPS
jgi:peptide/nickel transport system substrate-binding protein